MLKALQYIWSKCTNKLLPHKCLAVASTSGSSSSQSHVYSASPTNLSIVPLQQHEERDGQYDSWYQDQRHTFFRDCPWGTSFPKWLDLFAFSSILAGAGNSCRVFHQWQCERHDETNENESGCSRHFLIYWIQQHSSFGIFAPEHAIYNKRRIKALPHIVDFKGDDQPCTSTGAESDGSSVSSQCSHKNDSSLNSAYRDYFLRGSMDEKWDFLSQKSFSGSVSESISSSESSNACSDTTKETESLTSTSSQSMPQSSDACTPQREDNSASLPSQQNNDPTSVIALFMAHSLNAQGVAAIHQQQQHENSFDNIIGEQLWHQSCSLMTHNGGYVPSQYNIATLFHQRSRRSHQLGEEEQCLSFQKQAEHWYRLAWNRSGRRHAKTAYNLAVLMQEMASDGNEASSQEVLTLMEFAALANIEGAKQFLATYHRKMSSVAKQDVRRLHQSKSTPNFSSHWSTTIVQKRLKPFHKDDLQTHVLWKMTALDPSSCQNVTGREHRMQLTACVR